MSAERGNYFVARKLKFISREKKIKLRFFPILSLMFSAQAEPDSSLLRKDNGRMFQNLICMFENSILFESGLKQAIFRCISTTPMQFYFLPFRLEI